MEYLFAAPLNRGRYLALKCDQETAENIVSRLCVSGLSITQPTKFKIPAADGRMYPFKSDILDLDTPEEVVRLQIDDVVNQTLDTPEEVVRSHIDDVVNQTQDGNSLYVIRNEYYSYVLLDGDDQWMQYVRSTLEGMNLSIKREGQSFRPAADGIQYSWFLRLEKPIDPEDEDRIYEELSKEKYQEHIPVPDTSHELTELQAKLTSATSEIERAKERERELEQLITEAREELSRTERKLQSTREQEFNNENLRQAYNTLERSFRNSRIEIENLESELETLRGQDAQGHNGELPAATVEEYEHEISALRKMHEERETENRDLLEQQSELFRDKQEYSELLTEEESRCRSLQNELQGLNKDIAYFKDQQSQMKADLYQREKRIEKLTSQRDLIQAPVNNAEPVDQSIYERMLSLCLPNVEFVDRFSLPFVYNEVHDIGKVLRILTCLHYEESPKLDRSSVAGKSGWWETKFDTGPSQRNSGRIYYKPIGGDILKVLISDKRSQVNDIGRLPSD